MLTWFADILFKFAVDKEVAEGVWVYGGTSPSHENAMKAANHELRGLLSALLVLPLA